MFRLTVLALLIAAPAAAQTRFQDLKAIDAAVMGFTGRPVGSDGGARAPVDARLKLASCGTVSLAWRTAQHDAVVVSCPQPEWRIYVPVQAPVVPPEARAVAAAVAKPQPVIKRGDPVTIEAGAPGFSISRDGVAMGDAAPGGRFLVNVDGTAKPVQAIALESGRATLPGWGQ